MGEIVATALVSHVPPLAMPKEMRISPEGEDTDLIEGYQRLRVELDKVKPDTFVIIDTHWLTTSEHVVNGAPHHKGVLTSEEIPSVLKDIAYDYAGAPELGLACEEVGRRRGNIHSIGNRPQIVNIVDEKLPHHYSTINVITHLHRDEKVLSTGVCQTARMHNFFEFGATIREAIEQVDCRVVVLASGAMSHRMHEFDRVVSREGLTYRKEGITSPEAVDYDFKILSLWTQGDHAQVLECYPDYMRFFPEAWFGHYLTMLGTVGGKGFKGIGRPMSRYENQIGTGNIHVLFDVNAE